MERSVPEILQELSNDCKPVESRLKTVLKEKDQLLNCLQKIYTTLNQEMVKEDSVKEAAKFISLFCKIPVLVACGEFSDLLIDCLYSFSKFFQPQKSTSHRKRKFWALEKIYSLIRTDDDEVGDYIRETFGVTGREYLHQHYQQVLGEATRTQSPSTLSTLLDTIAVDAESKSIMLKTVLREKDSANVQEILQLFTQTPVLEHLSSAELKLFYDRNYSLFEETSVDLLVELLSQQSGYPSYEDTSATLKRSRVVELFRIDQKYQLVFMRIVREVVTEVGRTDHVFYTLLNVLYDEIDTFCYFDSCKWCRRVKVNEEDRSHLTIEDRIELWIHLQLTPDVLSDCLNSILSNQFNKHHLTFLLIYLSPFEEFTVLPISKVEDFLRNLSKQGRTKTHSSQNMHTVCLFLAVILVSCERTRITVKQLRQIFTEFPDEQFLTVCLHSLEVSRHRLNVNNKDTANQILQLYPDSNNNQTENMSKLLEGLLKLN